MEVDWTVLQSVLLWLVAGGAVVVANYAFAWLAENFEFWHKLPKAVKLLVPMIVAVLIAFGAQQLLQYPDIIEVIQPYWSLFIMILLGWLASQKGYVSARASRYGAEKRIQ